MNRYAVVGNPVSGSLSPAIHRAFARMTQRDVVYGVLSADDEDEFKTVVAGFFQGGGAGLNVTAPFKAAALALADKASAYARKAGAANVLRRLTDGQIAAANTDGAGLIADLRRNWEVELAAKTVLLIGAGGAAGGVVGALANNAPRAVQIVNRSADKAKRLAARFAGEAAAVDGGGLDEARPAQIVIHSSAAGFAGQAPPLAAEVFAGCELAYDLSYGEAAAPFADLARRGGAARAVDGLGMLAEQAALSFALWEGIKPTTRGVIRDLRAVL